MKLSHTRIGVLGAGQLALMLAEAGRSLDVEVICAGQRGDCAEQVAPVVVVDLEDRAAVRAFASQVDAVTIESENIDTTVLQGLNLYPNAKAIGIAQDRLLEKQFFEQCRIGVAPFAAVDSVVDFERAFAITGVPAILKTRRGGYDGKGQVRLQHRQDAADAFAEVGGVPCVLEGTVRFEAEISLIAARNAAGQIAFYPLTENLHREGILRTSIAPFIHAGLQVKAESYMSAVLERLEYTGVLAIEFFVLGDTLLANEMAPRVHNSGHWTIEGADTSQFENCLRAMSGMELGSTRSRPTVMLNCIGAMPTVMETTPFPMLFRHDYGKDVRAGRKVGHLTFPASETAAIEEWQRRLTQL
ncbi:MAG: 5-(carboxyamino)imidazole ribonucleotide synthase [Acidobacteriaceae bacterium]